MGRKPRAGSTPVPGTVVKVWTQFDKYLYPWYNILIMRKSKYTAELMEPLMKTSVTWTEVLHGLGLKMTGGNYRHIQSRVKALGISTDHFKGQGWAKGLTQGTDGRIAKRVRSQQIPDEEVFKKNSTYNTSALWKRLMRLGWEDRCAICGITEWCGEKLRLHVDHINGDSADHRLENLRLLCPNCHSQTKTYAGRNQQYRVEEKTCRDCGIVITRKSTRCKSCAGKDSQPTKIDWPSKEVLRDMVGQLGYSETGRRLGVSDNAVRKHV